MSVFILELEFHGIVIGYVQNPVLFFLSFKLKVLHVIKNVNPSSVFLCRDDHLSYMSKNVDIATESFLQIIYVRFVDLVTTFCFLEHHERLLTRSILTAN